LDFFEGACALACSAASSASSAAIAASARASRAACAACVASVPPALCVRCLSCHRGGGLRRRCVLPEELRDGRVAVVFGVLEGGARPLLSKQLGVGLGSQQRLHARLVPLVNGHHQGGGTVEVLQVGVGRVLQEQYHAMERRPWNAALMSAV